MTLKIKLNETTWVIMCASFVPNSKSCAKGRNYDLIYLVVVVS